MLLENESAGTNLIVIDDNKSDAGDVLALTGTDLLVTALAPISSVEECARAVRELAVGGAAAILIDYRLDSEENVRYRGGSLAGGIRDLIPEVPLVLYTTDAILHTEAGLRARARQVFDWVLEKDHFLSDSSKVRVELLSIAQAFAYANEVTEANLSRFLQLMLDAGDSQQELVSLMNPGVQAESRSGVVSWLLNVVLKQDGPLLTLAQAASALGLTSGAFNENLSAFDAARYRGVFSEMQPRWWLSAIDSVAYEIQTAELAECNWCGLDVQRSCSICGQPCGEAHAVPLIGEDDAGWSRGSVGCFRCIEAGRDSSVRIDPAFADLAQAIRLGQVSSDD